MTKSEKLWFDPFYMVLMMVSKGDRLEPIGMRRRSASILAVAWLGLLLSHELQGAVRVPGAVVSWGYEVMPAVQAGTAFKGIAAGSAFSLALKSDGTVVAWGDNSASQCLVPVGMQDVISLAAGWYHSLALKADGQVVSWGGVNTGRSTVPSGLSNVIAIAAGQVTSVALKADGTVVEWPVST